MARSIISCTGVQFDIGDKVRTSDGTVIRIEGAAIGKKFHNAELCTKVEAHVLTTREAEQAKLDTANAQAAKRGEPPVKPVGGGNGGSDCIVWGG
jgi:hypothetical protein